MTSANPVPPSRRALVLGAGALLGTAACSTDPSRGPVADSPSASSPTATARTASPASPAAPASTGAIGTGRQGAGTGASRPVGTTAPAIALTTGPDLAHGPAGRDEVALTFHGQGTRAITSEVLAACAAARAQVTVFAVGTWIQADPEQVRAVEAAGHEIGNHTWSHTQMKQISAATARAEVAHGRSAISAVGIDPGWWFRPSGTQRSTALIRSAALAAGYHRCVSYDVDPEDYLDPGARLVRSRTRKAVRAGSIVSLHLGHSGTAAALPGILSDLSAAGLAPVTLSTLFRD